MRVTPRAACWILLLVIVVVSAGCHRLVLPAWTPSSRVALKSHHGRYVIALGEEHGWVLRQSAALAQDDCGWFTRYALGQDELGNAIIALKTCHGRFVTAPRRGTTRLDREVWQESAPGDCGRFALENQGDGFALKTCAGEYLTAGDAGPGWEPPLQWAIIVEAERVHDWEVFEILPQR